MKTCVEVVFYIYDQQQKCDLEIFFAKHCLHLVDRFVSLFPQQNVWNRVWLDMFFVEKEVLRFLVAKSLSETSGETWQLLIRFADAQ